MIILSTSAHCGLVTPYGDIDLGQHWFRYWLVAWWHRTVTWTNVALSSVRSSSDHVRAISQEIPYPSVTKIRMETNYISRISFQSSRVQGVKPWNGGWPRRPICGPRRYLLHEDVIKWNIFRVTGPLFRGFTSRRWIPLKKASDTELWGFLRFSTELTVE